MERCQHLIDLQEKGWQDYLWQLLGNFPAGYSRKNPGQNHAQMIHCFCSQHRPPRVPEKVREG